MSEKTLLVITPSEGRDTGFTILHAETGEALASHFCSHEGFAKGDLYENRPERKEKWKERFGEIEVKFLDKTDITEEELIKRNQQWYDSLPKQEAKTEE